MKSKTLTVAVFLAIALVFSFGVAVEKASADTILFPWLVKSNTVFSLVSVVNTSAPETILCSQSLHYQYWYKKTSGNDRLETCVNQDFTIGSSMNDIVSFDAGGIYPLATPGSSLFNDQPARHGNATYTPDAFGNSSGPIPSRSFLLVDNNSGCNGDQFQASLYGEALIIETASGGAWGYVAYNGSRGEDISPVFFSDENDMQGEVLRSPRVGENFSDLESTPIVIYPNVPGQGFKTTMFVTPANYVVGQRTGNASARIQFCLDPDANDSSEATNIVGAGLGIQKDPSCFHPGIWDNDEGELSGNDAVEFICTGGLDIYANPSLGGLLTSAQVTYLTVTGGQAWTSVRAMTGTTGIVAGISAPGSVKSDAIVGKLDYTEGAITLAGKAIPNAVNNFTWIRNGASTDGFGILQHGINDLEAGGVD